MLNRQQPCYVVFPKLLFWWFFGFKHIRLRLIFLFRHLYVQTKICIWFDNTYIMTMYNAIIFNKSTCKNTPLKINHVSSQKNSIPILDNDLLYCKSLIYSIISTSFMKLLKRSKVNIVCSSSFLSYLLWSFLSIQTYLFDQKTLKIISRNYHFIAKPYHDTIIIMV